MGVNIENDLCKSIIEQWLPKATYEQKLSIVVSILQEKDLCNRGTYILDLLGQLVEIGGPLRNLDNLIKLYQYLRAGEFVKAVLFFERQMDQTDRDLVPKEAYSWMYAQFEATRT